MSAAGDALGWLERLAGHRILVVGDAMLDRFVYGTVERISPEGPIGILRVQRESAMPGGAGNVVRNLAALGVRSSFVAVVGADAAGSELRHLLAAEARVKPLLIVDRARETTIKTRYIGGAQQLLRADRESSVPLDAKTRAALLAKAQAALPQCDVLVLSDYGKGVLGDGVAGALIAAARRAGKPVLVDPKGADYARYAGADLVTPNQRELAEAGGLSGEGDDDIVQGARRLIARHRFKAVLATRSSRGLSLVPAKGAPVHVRAEAREVFDVAGAGDTVIATMAAALAAGAPLPVAAELGNAAAGIVVGKVGTAVASVAELRQALLRASPAAGQGKILPLEAVGALVGRWRRAGLRVGFTNGCFDLVHPGHVSLLRQARAACDRLVVGLNSDASVRRLKGRDRPVQNQDARAAVLASLGDVDAVVLFEQDTPLELIEALRPDVLVKGADYTEATVVGARLVRRYGGKVLLAQLLAGQSTSNLIGRMNGGASPTTAANATLPEGKAGRRPSAGSPTRRSRRRSAAKPMGGDIA